MTCDGRCACGRATVTSMGWCGQCASSVRISVTTTGADCPSCDRCEAVESERAHTARALSAAQADVAAKARALVEMGEELYRLRLRVEHAEAGALRLAKQLEVQRQRAERAKAEAARLAAIVRIGGDRAEVAEAETARLRAALERILGRHPGQGVHRACGGWCGEIARAALKEKP